MRCLALISLAVASLLAPAAAQAARAPGEGDLASGWWGPGSRIEVDPATGAASIAVRGGYAARDKLPVEGGRDYRVAVDIAGSGAPKAIVVQVSFRGPGVDPGWYGPLDAGPAHGDEPALIVLDPPDKAPERARAYAAVIAAPPAADEMVLYLREAGGTGTAVFSHVSVSPTDEPPTTAAGAAREEMAARAFPAGPCRADRGAALARLEAMGSPGSSPAPHRVAAGGRAAMGVHVGAGEDIVTLAAADELATYLGRITGGAFEPLSSDCHPGAAPMIVVGRDNALARALLGPAELDGLGDDGFVIRSAGDHLLVAGATPRGTMYGVDWLLDRGFGVHWLAPGHTVVPRAPTLDLPRRAERQRPRFDFREVLSAEAQDKGWRAHNLMNGQSHGPSFLPSPPAIDSWRRDWAAKGGIATFYELLPPERFAAAHPDWYAGGQLAMMNRDMRAAMAAAVIERFRRDPPAASGWFAIHDMDWGWDMDPASRAFADRHGGQPSAPRLDMMIDVAARVRAVFPDARFAFNAYHWSFAPPTGMSVPDHIMVYPMDIQLDYGHPIGIGTNAKVGADIRGWAAIADTVLFWDHIADFAGYIQPTPNLATIAGNIAWLAKLPQVRGYFAEGSWETPGAEFAGLRAWMIARLLWNPSEDPGTVIAAFCDGYYGPASALVQRYIALEQAALARSGDVFGEKAEVDLKMYDAGFLRSADVLFDEAERLAAGTPYAEAVAEARLPVDYVVLLRRDELAGGAWPLHLEARLRRFWDTVARSGVTRYMQGGDIAQLRELIAIDRKPAAPPGIVPPGDVWVDYQDLGMNRYDGVPVVADAAASDVAAIRIGPQASGWDVQFKLDKLPASGRWWLYASVRTDGPHPPAVRLGAYPPMDCASLFRDVPGGPRYHWIEVPGGPFARTTDHGTGVYLQASGGPDRGNLFLDRVIASAQRLDAVMQPSEAAPASCGTGRTEP